MNLDLDQSESEARMTNKKLAFATLAGASAAFVMEVLLCGVLLADFFGTNTGSATGVNREEPSLVTIALGQIPLALLLTLFISRWGHSPSMAAGMRLGAMFGFLVELGLDLTMYGTTNIANLTATLVDPFVTLSRDCDGCGHRACARRDACDCAGLIARR
jgi:hypothetical protein